MHKTCQNIATMNVLIVTGKNPHASILEWCGVMWGENVWHCFFGCLCLTQAGVRVGL